MGMVLVSMEAPKTRKCLTFHSYFSSTFFKIKKTLVLFPQLKKEKGINLLSNPSTNCFVSNCCFI